MELTHPNDERPKHFQPASRQCLPIALRSEVKMCDVEEHGCSEAERINAIQDPAMPWNRCAIIRDATTALDRAHYQASEQSHQSDRQRHQCRLPPVKRWDPAST